MAIHASILAWKIPRTEEPGRLHSIRFIRNSISVRLESILVINMAFYIGIKLLNHKVFRCDTVRVSLSFSFEGIE